MFRLVWNSCVTVFQSHINIYKPKVPFCVVSRCFARCPNFSRGKISFFFFLQLAGGDHVALTASSYKSY